MTGKPPQTIAADAAWRHLRELTPARIALGRSGASLPTREVLGFALAHAQARDAVHQPFDVDAIRMSLGNAGNGIIVVDSAAGSDRSSYLCRPDLGRILSHAGRERLAGLSVGAADLAIVVGDGLSSAAVHHQAAGLLSALLPRLAAYRLSPIIVARGARVAIGDEIGQLLRARMVAVLIGERPGLSSPDSLGVYLTYGPTAETRDAARNCVSNIHRAGLTYDEAARRIAWLIDRAMEMAQTGVALKDTSGAAPGLIAES